MRFSALGIAGLFLLGSGGAASAHHSGAMFDQAKTITVVGTVREFKWASPHAWLYLVMAVPGGMTEEYAVELSSINIIARRGWDRHSANPGDRLSVTVHPMRDGGKQGLLLSMTLPGGKVLTDHDY